MSDEDVVRMGPVDVTETMYLFVTFKTLRQCNQPRLAERTSFRWGGLSQRRQHWLDKVLGVCYFSL